MEDSSTLAEELSLFWQKDKSNSHLALRELHLSHKTLRDIKKDALTVDSIHMQYNMSCPQTRFYIFSTSTEIHS